MKKTILITGLSLLFSGFVLGQNPFQSIGQKSNILTLTDGKYPEVFENDTLQIIGDVVFNTVTNKIEYFIKRDTMYSEATMESEIVSRWLSRDPLAAKFSSMSPYNFVGNSPIMNVDPDGRDINFYMWKDDGDGGSEIKKVTFSELNVKSKQAVIAFMRTDEGLSFIKQFANKGDKIGYFEFTEDGVYSNHDLEVAQYSTYGADYGGSTFRIGKDNLKFDLKFNINREEDDENATSIAITIGHESFLHIDQFLKDAVDAYDSGNMKEVKKIKAGVTESAAKDGGADDHKGYINGNKSYSRMGKFVEQLKGVFKKETVNREIKDHDSKYKHLKK